MEIVSKGYNNFEEKYKDILAKKQCFCLKDLAIDGKDLIAMGIKPGKKIGEELSRLLEAVLDNPELNTAEKLKELVKEWEKNGEAKD